MRNVIKQQNKLGTKKKRREEMKYKESRETIAQATRQMNGALFLFAGSMLRAAYRGKYLTTKRSIETYNSMACICLLFYHILAKYEHAIKCAEKRAVRMIFLS